MNQTKIFGTFFLPGPTEVRQEILAAMTPNLQRSIDGDLSPE